MKKLFILLLLSTQYCIGQQAVLVTQEKNTGLITKIAFSANGRYIAFASEGDNKIKMFDVQSGKMIGALSGHENSIKSLDFSPDGDFLVSGDKVGMIFLWDLNNWQVRDSLKGIQPITALKYLSSGSEFVAGLDNGVVQKVTIKSMTTTKLITLKGTVKCIAVSGDNIAAGSSSGQMWLNNNLIKAHKKAITGIQFTSDEGSVTSSEDGSVKSWLKGGEMIKEIDTKQGGVTCMDYTPKKEIVITGGEDHTLQLYNMKSGELLHRFQNGADKADGAKIDETIRDVVFSPDGNSAASSGFKIGLFRKVKSNDNVIKVWDINRFQLFKTLEGVVNPIVAFCFHPVENKLVTMYNNEISIWDLNSGERFGIVVLHEREKEKQEITEDVKEEKGKNFGNALGKFAKGELSTDNVVTNAMHSAKVKTAKSIRSLMKEEPYISYTGKGNYFITYFPKDELRMYDVKDGIPVYNKAIYPDQGHISDLACDPNEKFIACAGSSETPVSIIDCSTGELLTKLQYRDINKGTLLIEAKAVSFSPDGSLLAAAFNNGSIRVWNTSSWSEYYKSNLVGGIGGRAFLNFSKTGNRLFVKTVNGVAIFDMSTVSLFGNSSPKVDGLPRIIHCPSDYLITQSDAHLTFANLINDNSSVTSNFETKNITQLEVNKMGMIGASFNNGEFKLWSPETGKELFVMVGEDENVIFKTPENYYKVSKEGHSLVTFRVGKEAYPFEQFDAKYNRPDIVLKAMNSEDEGLIKLYKLAYDKRLKKLGLKESDLGNDLHLPQIEVTNLAEIPIVTEGNEATFNLNITDDKYNLSSLHVWVNNVPIYGAKGKSVEHKQLLQQELTVKLGGRKNIIQIAVQNEKGAVSLKQTVKVFSTIEAKPVLFIVSVGTSTYKDSRYNLQYAAKDATDLLTLLSDNSKGYYKEIKHLLLTNNEVVKGNFDKVKAFLSESDVNDVVIVFVAGHGVLDNNFDYYYGTYNMDFESPSGLGLEYSQLESVLDGIGARKKMLIMDTCHSGEIEKDEVTADNSKQEVEGDVVFRGVGVGVKQNTDGISPSKMMNQLFTDIRLGTGATVITSAGGAEYAMESDEWKNGLFTYSLLFGLRNGGADIDNNGIIMLSELQKYTVDLVSKLSNGRQIPTTRMQNYEMDYRVW